MTIEDQLNASIASLEEARADAAKIDKGKTGAPGARLRKVALQVKNEMGELRKAVLATRE